MKVSAKMTPEQRRAAFIADIVEVCKRHRVKVDRGELVEIVADEDDMLFYVKLKDIESAVRESVWPIVHGEGK